MKIKKIESEWPNEENFDKLDEGQAFFLFEQAEKQLKETSDIGNIVVTRATTLITLVSGLLIALIGYSFSRWQTIFHLDTLTETCLFVSAYLCIIIVLLALNIIGKNYFIIGSEPKSLFVDAFFNSPLSDSKRLIHFYVSEIVNYQRRIEKNKKKNKIRWKLFNISLFMVLAIPLIISITYAIVNHYG